MGEHAGNSFSSTIDKKFDRPWQRHTIDSGSQGADGVRLSDANGDGLLDIATGWEEGGVTRVYHHPGVDKVRLPWPAVTIGQTPNVEDAVWMDVDGDGQRDIVSSCEGGTQSLIVHWAPAAAAQWQDAGKWQSNPFPFPKSKKQKWMFALPMDVDGQRGTDLVVGSKGAGASVGWLESPTDPRDLSTWRYHRWMDAGWIMSLRAVDVDSDGDTDVLCSDRRGKDCGVRWLENPGPAARGSTTVPRKLRWPVHNIGAHGQEAMFLDVVPAKPPFRRLEIVAAIKAKGLMRFRRQDRGKGVGTLDWSVERIPWPAMSGREKGVAIGDIDLDGRADLVISSESAERVSGVRWLRNTGEQWQSLDIAGTPGTKFDRIELVDLDTDGDLDVLTCEERENLGVIWYENPLR